MGGAIKMLGRVKIVSFASSQQDKLRLFQKIEEKGAFFIVKESTGGI